MEDHQVIIAGAGPAGSSCAKALIEEGIDVLIVEKKNVPRYKTCSGVLFGQTQVLLKKYFGQLPPESVYCRPKIINTKHISEWNREKGFFEFVWELPKDGQKFSNDCYNIWRNKFDHWLLEQSGAPYQQNCAVKNFTAQQNGVRVDLTGTAEKALTCAYLIGADGGSSKVRRLLDPSWSKEAPEVSVYQTYYQFSNTGDLKPGKWAVFFDPDISDTLCCVHHKDDFLTLCVGGFRGRDLKAAMEIFKKFLSENFNVTLEKEERSEGCVMRPGPPNLGKDRVILTGEAAGFMYLNGEGISAAMDSGYRAGKAVAQAIKENANATDIYQKNTGDILKHVGLCMEKMHFFATEM